MEIKLDALIALLILDMLVLDNLEVHHHALYSVEIVKNMVLKNVIMEIKLDALIAVLIMVIHVLVKLELLLVAL
jgi:hypothetical protein